MPELKRTFLKGRMNQDLDERLLPNGEYFDATNIQVSTSEGSDVGAIESVLGNTRQGKRSSSQDWALTFGFDNPVCIGGLKDNQNNKIYWFLVGLSAVPFSDTAFPVKCVGYIILLIPLSSTKDILI